MTTKTPESLLNEAFISEDVCMESLRSVIQKHNERVREALHELDQLRARVSELERERDEARNEFKLYAGWSKWKPGIWLIEHPETGPSATYIGERDAATEALKRARVAIEKAPHPSSCDGWRAVSGQTLIFRAKRCDCWKAAALHDLAAAETDK